MARDFLDKVSRLALAIERAGGDHLGDTSSLHKDLIDIIKLVPPHLHETEASTAAPREGAAEGGLDEEAEEEDLRLSSSEAR